MWHLAGSRPIRSSFASGKRTRTKSPGDPDGAVILRMYRVGGGTSSTTWRSLNRPSALILTYVKLSPRGGRE